MFCVVINVKCNRACKVASGVCFAKCYKIRRCHNSSRQLIIGRLQEVNFLVVYEKLALQLHVKFIFTFTRYMVLAQQSSENFSFAELPVYGVIKLLNYVQYVGHTV